MLAQTPYHLDLRTLPLPHTSLGAWGQLTFPVLKSALWRFFHHKRWIYLWVDGEDWLLGLAIVDLGYMAKTFVFMAEKSDAKPVIQTEALFLPQAELGVHRTSQQRLRALAVTPKLKVQIEISAEGQLGFLVEGPELHIWGQADKPQAPLLVAANRLNQGGPNFTAKGMAHAGKIAIRYKDRQWPKRSVQICSDFTEGFLPRETRWYWASLTGRAESGQAISLNLVEGFNGACECVLWVNDRVYPLGEGRFQGQDPHATWQVNTTCGTVALHFEPWSALWDQTRLGVANSDFRQIYGVYSGQIKTAEGLLELKQVRGIAEYQAVKW